MKNGLVTAGYRPAFPASILCWNPFSSPFIHHHLHCSISLSTHSIEDSDEEKIDISEKHYIETEETEDSCSRTDVVEDDEQGNHEES